MDYNEEIMELSAEDLEKIAGGKKQKVRAIKAGVNIHELPGEKQLCLTHQPGPGTLYSNFRRMIIRHI